MIKNKFAHFGNCGDVLASLPAIKEFYKKTKIKPILYLVKDHPAIYYEGCVHPIKDDKGNHVSLNETMVKMLIPLLKEQDYLEDVKEWDGEEIDFNLSKIRDTNVNCPYGDLRRWYFYIFPELACDLSKKYLYVPDALKNLAKEKIIVCRTERYLNEKIDYSFLKPYENDIVFAGTNQEHTIFCNQFNLKIDKLEVNDFLELAQALRQSKFLLSNQTMIFQIAEGLKIPRIVELCHFAPNVIPVGENAFDFYAQIGLEYYFHTLNGTIEDFKGKFKNSQPKLGEGIMR